ncbi:MAG: PQQ-binding-like beta-propeller repeat protein [Planctomycetales bacterium]|nr:PQQ-binding-like beta-propeller repeat protein [Planctomycetales bacterium]
MLIRFPLAIPLPGFIIPLASANDWAQFRGFIGGVAMDAQLPTQWSTDQNIQWKTEIPGYGWSQPIIVGDKVFVTTAITKDQKRTQATRFPGGEDPREQGGPGVPPPGNRPPPGAFPSGPGQGRPPAFGGPGGARGPGGPFGMGPPDAIYQWKIYCLDRLTGQEIWNALAFEGTPTIGIEQSNTYASQTPLADNDRLYAYFGMTGIFCFDLNGKLLWSKDLGSYPVMFGPGSSPAMDDERVFVQCDNDEQSFLVALDKKSGDEVWRVDRDERSNYSTPYVWRNKIRTELVTCGDTVRSYDPATGKLFWEFKNFGGGVKPSPVGDADRLCVCNSGRGNGSNSPIVMFIAGASGDISLKDNETSNTGVLWRVSPGGGGMASPLMYQGCVYVLQQNGGILGCYDANTGERYYRQRLRNATEFWSSPWAAAGKVYCLDSDGQTFVFEAGPELKIVATNSLDDNFRSSVAIAHGQILFRGVDRLYSVTE